MQNRNLQPAIELIKRFEGCVLRAYRDPVGIWTIGYGTTKNVRPGMKITQAAAVELLLNDLDDRLEFIEMVVKVPTTDDETCALLSFAYNVGLSALQKSTLLRKLNAGRPRVEVAAEFDKWTRAGGKVLRGLVRRRAAERDLFLRGHGRSIDIV